MGTQVMLGVGMEVMEAGSGQATYPMTVQAGPTHPATCVVTGVPPTGAVPAGAPLTLTVEALDAYGNRRVDTAEVVRWRYVVLGEGEAAEGVFTAAAPGLYTTTLTPRTATVLGRSSLSLTVTLRGEELYVNSELTIEVRAPLRIPTTCACDQ